MYAYALAVGAARALDERREHELCALRDTERDKKHRLDPSMLACEGAAWLPQAGRTHTHALSAAGNSFVVCHGLQSDGRVTGACVSVGSVANAARSTAMSAGGTASA